jgi:queuine tRNA-ribosyltransferase
MPASFQIKGNAKDSAGPRRGVISTPHGDIETPAFMPVATQGSVKALAPEDLHRVGCEVFIANTYHLSLRPGVDAVEALGGLHTFSSWDGPIATDSGGFQVSSLAQHAQISDEAITFRSHIDGSPLHLSPETVITLQERLGADILMCLDQPLNYGADEAAVRDATRRTHVWASRCVQAHQGPGLLYGIIQGGTSLDLRQESSKFIRDLDVQGYAIGGLSLGEPKELMWEIVDQVMPLLPKETPVHLLGVGSPEDLIEGVARGVDTFDCALPTRVARNGGIYTEEGRVSIISSRFRTLDGPLLEGCDCWTCDRFSAAYVHHLFKAKELLAHRLASIHNLRFVLALLERARASIADGTFANLRSEFISRFRPPDGKIREAQRERYANSPRVRAQHKLGNSISWADLD